MKKKINIKMFVYGRTRDQSKQWFRKYTECFFFTYNYVRNQMYMGTVTNYHKKRKFTKKIKQVSTDSNPLANVRTRLTSIIGLGFEKTDVSSEEKMTMKTDEIQKIMEIFFNNIPGFKHEYHWLTSPDAQFYKFFLEKKEIKLPNNWQSLIYNYPQPKKKDYKKYKFKYVDAFMSVNKLKGDKIKRALHNINTCHPNSYQIACSYFGEKYILSQSDEVLCSILQSFLSTSYKNLDKVLKTKKEKDNCFKIFKLCLDGSINDWTFNDHLRMYENLSTYEPVKWTSNDYDSFNEEHYQWSERFGFYTKGDFTRVYNNVFVNEVNRTINDGNIEYYPVVLSTSREYNMESFNQNNCVKNYVNRPSSFIISLRKDSTDSKERATIEYRIRLRDDGKICLDRVQTLGRFNQRLGSEWDKPIKDLDNRLNHILLNNKFDIPKLLIKIGNKVVKTEGTFEVDENAGFFNIKGEMKWKHNVDFIESIPEYYDIPY